MSKAVIFDLDGTLTVPMLDFDGIRAELGLPPGPILEAMATMPPDRRRLAEACLEQHEGRAARESTLQPGTHETISALRDRGFALAIMTRNERRWVNVVIEKHNLQFDVVHCRDDGVVKPSPEPVFAICRELTVEPAHAWVVGDFLFDIQSGNAAGSPTILMLGDLPLPKFADQASYVIRRLAELIPIVTPG